MQKNLKYFTRLPLNHIVMEDKAKTKFSLPDNTFLFEKNKKNRAKQARPLYDILIVRQSDCFIKAHRQPASLLLYIVRPNSIF
jgi:hypothetical protein